VPHVGGIEFIVDRLALGLVAEGHTVTHVASDTEVNRATARTVPYERILLPAWQIARDQWALPYPLFSPIALLKTLRRTVAAADIVHAHGMLYIDSAFAFAVDRHLGRNRRVLTEHVGHIPYDNKLLDAIERAAIHSIGRYTAANANALITYNNRVSREVMSLVPGAQPIHIENGIDLEMYRPPLAGERQRLRNELGWDERPRVLFVGRLVEKKGINLVMEVARRADDLQFVLAGPGSLQDVPTNVQLLGELSPGRVASLYRAADVFLLPSRGEGFPLSAQEALASGLPVILGDDPGYAASGIPCRLVPPDPDAILSTLRELIADRKPLSDIALQSWATTVQKHLEVYEDVLRKDR
jgi:glycosyltransferase involved in cell wall biosynthesis